MDKRKIVRYLLITLSVILGVLVFLSITGTVAHAAGLVVEKPLEVTPASV